MYFRWESEEGIQVRLVESKAKLTPADQRGDPIKAESCGAAFATKLKGSLEKLSQMQVGRWFHLVDSTRGNPEGEIQVPDIPCKRVGEIQHSTPVETWMWILGELNIADLLTKGAAQKISENTLRGKEAQSS